MTIPNSELKKYERSLSGLLNQLKLFYSQETVSSSLNFFDLIFDDKNSATMADMTSMTISKIQSLIMVLRNAQCFGPDFLNEATLSELKVDIFEAITEANDVLSEVSTIREISIVLQRLSSTASLSFSLARKICKATLDSLSGKDYSNSLLDTLFPSHE
ncbi:hypothetical protein L1267_17060 [Pseudoalteromonas sp. OFAV1]|uniref:hypothetical protein n=1 Tax=Pseudoalteromonas sp. OFAV1 TaxID=2908892 RepID=UPI001F16CAFD|nr:hypothetical protein [Pseudoalteromonas sp. OFAV1]MCF2902088.1 hypothetical protein [Pseudoalteromonas sp. OFAV1]